MIGAEQFDLLLDKRLQLGHALLDVAFEHQRVRVQRAAIQHIDGQAVAIDLARQFMGTPRGLEAALTTR